MGCCGDKPKSGATIPTVVDLESNVVSKPVGARKRPKSQPKKVATVQSVVHPKCIHRGSVVGQTRKISVPVTVYECPVCPKKMCTIQNEFSRYDNCIGCQLRVEE